MQKLQERQQNVQFFSLDRKYNHVQVAEWHKPQISIVITSCS